MKAKNYTTPKTSQAISAVVEVDTETHCFYANQKWHFTTRKAVVFAFNKVVPVYSLSEALLAIEELGKVRNPKESLVSQTVRQQKLFVAWQQDGEMMNGEAVSEFLISLFKE